MIAVKPDGTFLGEFTKKQLHDHCATSGEIPFYSRTSNIVTLVDARFVDVLEKIKKGVIPSLRATNTSEEIVNRMNELLKSSADVAYKPPLRLLRSHLNTQSWVSFIEREVLPQFASFTMLLPPGRYGDDFLFCVEKP